MVEKTGVELGNPSGLKLDPDCSNASDQILNSFGERSSDADRSPSPEGTGSDSGINGSSGEFDSAFQKLLGNLPFRPAFSMNHNFFAAFQQQQQQMLNNFGATMVPGPSTPSSSRQTPERNDEECENEELETMHAAEPEDLSLSRPKDKKPSASPETEEPGGTGSTATAWSFEEQFKQLYEISTDERRKAWLDDWFSYMQQIGKPVTRIPIMAKNVLDLYELYHLVVKNGGLVEIINKKLWREITKGLNLPPSITSAAFTLRTQYQRYLYDYECSKENLSTKADLEAAIESNKREGRRNPGSASIGGGGNQGSIGTPTSVNQMLNGSGSGMQSPWGMPPLFGRLGNPFGIKSEDEGVNLVSGFSNAQHALAAAVGMEQRQLEILQRAAAEAARGQMGTMNGRSGRSSASSLESGPVGVKRARHAPNFFPTGPAAKKPANSTNMKLTTKDNHMYVSMEVNGVVYQGVLLAVGGSSTRASPLPVHEEEPERTTPPTIGLMGPHALNLAAAALGGNNNSLTGGAGLPEGLDLKALSALLGQDLLGAGIGSD